MLDKRSTHARASKGDVELARAHTTPAQLSPDRRTGRYLSQGAKAHGPHTHCRTFTQTQKWWEVDGQGWVGRWAGGQVGGWAGGWVDGWVGDGRGKICLHMNNTQNADAQSVGRSGIQHWWLDGDGSNGGDGERERWV